MSKMRGKLPIFMEMTFYKEMYNNHERKMLLHSDKLNK